MIKLLMSDTDGLADSIGKLGQVKGMEKAMAIMRGGLLAARTSFLWLNAAMYANPAGLVVAGVVALTAGVTAAIYYWDDLKATIFQSQLFDVLTLQFLSWPFLLVSHLCNSSL